MALVEDWDVWGPHKLYLQSTVTVGGNASHRRFEFYVQSNDACTTYVKKSSCSSSCIVAKERPIGTEHPENRQLTIYGKANGDLTELAVRRKSLVQRERIWDVRMGGEWT